MKGLLKLVFLRLALSWVRFCSHKPAMLAKHHRDALKAHEARYAYLMDKRIKYADAFIAQAKELTRRTP